MATLIPRVTMGTGSLNSLSLTFPDSSGFYNKENNLEAVVSGTSSLSITQYSNLIGPNGTVSEPSIQLSSPGNGLWKDSCINVSASSVNVSKFCSQGLTISNGNLSVSPGVFVMSGTNTISTPSQGIPITLGFDTIITNLGNIVSYTGTSTGGSFNILTPGYYIVSFYNNVTFSGPANPRTLNGELVIDGITVGSQTCSIQLKGVTYTMHIYQCLYISSSLLCKAVFTSSNPPLTMSSTQRYITFFRLF